MFSVASGLMLKGFSSQVNLSSHLTRSLQRGATARPGVPSPGQLDALSHFVDSAFSVNIAILTCRLPLVGAIRDYSVAGEPRWASTRCDLMIDHELDEYQRVKS